MAARDEVAPRPFPLADILRLAAVGLAYYIAAKIGLRLALVEGQVTPLWPPTGIALVALLAFGLRITPAIAVAAFIVNEPLGSLSTTAGITVGNTLAPLVAFALLKGAGFRDDLSRLRDGVLLVFLGGAGMLTSATIGSLTLLATDVITTRDFATTWWVWWTGDAMGVFVFAPAFLSLPAVRARGFAIVEAGILLVLAGMVTHFAVYNSTHPIYLVFPFLIWSALRFGRWGTSAIALLISIYVTNAVAQGSGLFADETLLWRMASLHAFTGTVALTALLLAAAMTERAQAHAALQRAGAELEERVRERTAQLEEAQRLTHVGSWVWNIPENAVEWSDEMYRLYGYEPRSAAVTFEMAMERVHEEDQPRIRKNLETVYATGRDTDVPVVDYRVRLPDGTERILQGRGRLMFADGSPWRMVGTVMDVTPARLTERQMQHALEQQQHAAEELRRADELKDEFLSTVSHELRTPLTPIVGLADLLRSSIPTNSTPEELGQHMYRNAVAMQRLIDQLLDYTRLRAGRVDVRPQPIALREALEHVVAILATIEGDRRVVLDVDPALRIRMDPDAFERVAGNLIGNAMRFSPEDTPVTVSADQDDANVTVRVRDEGPGIDAEYLPNVFERFYQAPGSHRGAGLGLSIARTYVQLHDGRIWAESEPGKGSTFSFSVPG